MRYSISSHRGVGLSAVTPHIRLPPASGIWGRKSCSTCVLWAKSGGISVGSTCSLTRKPCRGSAGAWALTTLSGRIARPLQILKLVPGLVRGGAALVELLDHPTRLIQVLVDDALVPRPVLDRFEVSRPYLTCSAPGIASRPRRRCAALRVQVTNARLRKPRSRSPSRPVATSRPASILLPQPADATPLLPIGSSNPVLRYLSNGLVPVADSAAVKSSRMAEEWWA